MRAHRHRGGFVRTPWPPTQVPLEEARVVAIKQMPDQTAVQIGRTEQPVSNREGEIHVHLHHRRALWWAVVPAQYVDERAVADEPVLLDMTGKVHELVYEIHASRHAHEQPTHIGRRVDRRFGRTESARDPRYPANVVCIF